MKSYFQGNGPTLITFFPGSITYCLRNFKQFFYENFLFSYIIAGKVISLLIDFTVKGGVTGLSSIP